MARELDLAGRVDLLDHSTCLGVEHDPIAEPLVIVHPAQDGYVLGVDLAKDRVGPWREVRDTITFHIQTTLVIVHPAQDGDAVEFNLREDCVSSRCDVWDLDQNPCLRPHP